MRSNPAKKPMLRRARFDTIRIMTAGSSPSRLPDFLIIGGMKCGSTTLFRDLDTSPAVSFPAHKEPHNLLDDAVLSGEGKAKYAGLYKHARPDQRLGDASTGYTKLPTNLRPQRSKPSWVTRSNWCTSLNQWRN